MVRTLFFVETELLCGGVVGPLPRQAFDPINQPLRHTMTSGDARQGFVPGPRARPAAKALTYDFEAEPLPADRQVANHEGVLSEASKGGGSAIGAALVIRRPLRMRHNHQCAVHERPAFDGIPRQLDVIHKRGQQSFGRSHNVFRLPPRYVSINRLFRTRTRLTLG